VRIDARTAVKELRLASTFNVKDVNMVLLVLFDAGADESGGFRVVTIILSYRFKTCARRWFPVAADTLACARILPCSVRLPLRKVLCAAVSLCRSLGIEQLKWPCRRQAPVN